MALLLLTHLILSAAATSVEPRQATPAVPDFVTKYAPLVFLDSRDAYRPSDISAQLANTQPELNSTVIYDAPSPLTLDNLNGLNDLGGEDVYLTSKEDIEQDPAWLFGQYPDESGKTGDAITSAIIVNDHGDGMVDAFYMYFYAFNFGGIYFGFNVGNHVGDWEVRRNLSKELQVDDRILILNSTTWSDFRTALRRRCGTASTPKGRLSHTTRSRSRVIGYAYFRQHRFANNPTDQTQPIAYSANGTHAVYGTAGTHDHTIPNIDLPNGPLQDYTDKGPLWDPLLSAYYYSYDATSSTFTPYDDSYPVNWLYFNGRWGDKQYLESYSRQELVLGIKELAKYGNGPAGPRDKQLNRTEVCPDDGNLCIVRDILTP